MGVVLCSQAFEYKVFSCFTLVDKRLSNSAYVIPIFSSDDGQSCRNVQQMSTKLGSLSVGVIKESVTFSSEGLLFRSYLRERKDSRFF